MLRSKSPFKKRSPKVDSSDSIPAPLFSVHHFSSVQEFQELQRQQQLLNGNAWAQQMGRSRANSVSVNEPNTPQTAMTSVIQSLESTDHLSSTAMDATTASMKRRVQVPLKLVPDNAMGAVPTQRDDLENKKHALMQMQMNMATLGNISEDNARLSTDFSAADVSKADEQHASRPKSPGKKLFQKFFRHYTSSETPPKTSLEWEETPEKAVKILGKESLKRRKEYKTATKQSGTTEGLLDSLDFKCIGASVHNRSATTLSANASTPSTAEFTTPTDCGIPSVGETGRQPMRVSASTAQPTVNDAATLDTISPSIEGKLDGSGQGLCLRSPEKHLQYLNNIIPPTPPSKESTAFPAIITRSPLDVKKTKNDSPSDTPSSMYCMFNAKREEQSTLPEHLGRYCGKEYLNLVLNKPSFSSLRDSPSIRSTYGFVVSPATELANGSTFDSPITRFIESPIIPRSAGLSMSRNVSLESKTTETTPHGRALSRRWSDGSLAAWKAQSEKAVPCLPPAFYSPYGYIAPGCYANFARPSTNEDVSLYCLPQASVGELESSPPQDCTAVKPMPISPKPSFELVQKSSDASKPHQDATPSAKPRKFVVRKRCSSDIADHARKDVVDGLGLSPLITQTMHHISGQTGSENSPSPGGPPSAMPPPLNVFRNPSMGPLPAKDELDAFLALHLHVDGIASTIHNLIDRKVDENIQVTTSKHDETLKILSTSFDDILAKIGGLDEQLLKTHDNLNAFKSDMNEKVMAIINVLQDKVLDSMDKMIESNTLLDQSVAQLIARVVDLEKNQKDVLDILSTQGLQEEKNIAHPPVRNNRSPSPSSANPSPHRTFAAHNFAVSYPTAFSATHVTSAGGTLYPYGPYADPFTAHPNSYVPAQAWNGHVIEASFAKLPKEQRAQHLQARYGGGAQLHRHPAYRKHERSSGAETNLSRDGANGA
ncbi:uncharacterized protein PV09_06628 [Verruconis gallopava]|uniref:Uncharacterized protein n=1 Tax=Verruconis gallopava TaxID=253628 RepID=A0A0D1YN15_9PEZI|nr:uncharacterized protein PV09_06628 [Verruconis gallopava]KIW02142.1 hypothetical protein PV09_06628 [Verruconis gallopava]